MIIHRRGSSSARDSNVHPDGGTGRLSTRVPVHRKPTVRLIGPDEQPERRPDGRFGRSPDHELQDAVQRLEACRRAADEANRALAEADAVAARHRKEAEARRRAFDQARAVARRSELTLHQRQRTATDAKLELRRALEWLARIEGASRAVGDLPSRELD